MKKTLMAVTGSLVLLSGCASNDYKLYAEAQQRIAQSEAQKETARYQALAEIARQGDTAAKVAAVMSIQFNGGSGSGSPKQQVAAPVSSGETALRWAGVLLPTFGQFYTISQNSKVAITQSNNSTALGMKQSDNQTAVAINTNNAFTTMNAAGLTTANSIATTGLTTANSIATTGLNSVTSVANTGMNNLSGLGIRLVDILPELQPNITTTSTTTNTTTNPPIN